MSSQWQPAEQLLFGDEDNGVDPSVAQFVANGGSWIGPPIFASRRRTSEFRDVDVQGYRSGSAAVYRHQEGDPTCDCDACSRERWRAQRKQGTTRRDERLRGLVRALVKRAPAFPAEI